jgi:glycosyltransferase involved in cell wall biosynthesis/SAM-dependent methyltransferase
MSMDLPFTGERYVPGITGNIFLEHLHRYVLAARIVAGKDVLDIASGEGFGSSLLAEAARSVIGVDISEDAVTHAQTKYGGPRLRFQAGSAMSIPLPDASVDVVVSFETIEHISGHEEMLAEVKRVLRQGGVLMMSTPDKATYSDASGYVNPFHLRELYRDQFHALLSSQFAHVRMHGQRVSFGSLIVAEDAPGLFAETDSRTMQTVPGLASPLYLIGIASDDPGAAVAMQGLFSQDMQASEPVQVRVEYELKEAQARFDQALSLRDRPPAQPEPRPASPLYLVDIAPDDPAVAVVMPTLFSQDIQTSEPVPAPVEYALKETQVRFEQERRLHGHPPSEAKQSESMLPKSLHPESLHPEPAPQPAEPEAPKTIREAALFEDIKWMSAEIATLQRSNWMSRASLSKLLRRMIKVRLLYALSRSTLFSDRRRAKFLRSAEKRDPMLLSARLDRFCQEYYARIEQSSSLVAEERQELMMHGTSVTAVVPNYNHARYLRERLDSILSQTYPLIDIIVLDDCSTDDSRQVIEEYVSRHPDRIKAVYNDANSGSVFRQWQKGHELATGDLVWFCESDDFCAPSFVERLIGHFRDPSVMLAFGKIEFADAAGNAMPGMAHYLETAEAGIWDQPRIRPAATWFKGAFGVKNVIANVGGSLWRRAPLAQATWDEARSYRIMGDWYLYSVLANGGQIAFDPAALTYFRIHGQNTSGAGAQGTPDYYREYARLMTALKRRWPIPDQTIERFVDNCHTIYRGAGLKSPAFETLVPAPALKAVKTETPHVLVGMLGFSYGGGEIFPIHLANALHARGAMVSVLTMMDTEDHPDVRAMLNPAIPVYSANGARDMGVRNFVTWAGITIVHSHIASIEMLLLDEGNIDLPYLSTLHGSYEAMEVPKRSVAAWAAKIDRFGYTTDRNLEAFAEITVPQEKFCKLRNAMPVDPRPYGRTRAEMNIPEEAVVFTLVARGVAGKGWPEAIKAFQALRARRPDVAMAFLAVGEGPLTTAAREIAGTDPDIHFLGFDNAIHGIYRLSDVAVVPTRFPGESYPLCLIQAMQVGIPAIATDTGEIVNMMRRDGHEAGLTIPYLQDDEAFVAAVVEAMDQMLDPELRARLAKGAAALGAVYAIDRLAGDYLALYQDILDRRA